MLLRTAVRLCMVATTLALHSSGILAAAKPDRAPIPDEASRNKASSVIKEVHAERYEKAKSPSERLALAEDLVRSALEPACDTASRYVLLRAAKSVATGVGDAAMTLAAVDELGKHFEVDVAELRCAAVKDLLSTARSPLQRVLLAARCHDMIREALRADSFEAAKQLNQYAISLSRRARHEGLVRQMMACKKRIAEAEASLWKVKPAMEVLAKDPGDQGANLAVGHYLCFVKGDWRRGLPMLALGGDRQLAPLAEKELRGISSPDACLAHADAWWDLADREKGSARWQLLRHAGAWYRRALPSLSALSKARAEKRVREAQQETAPEILWLAQLEPEHITVLGPRIVPASPEEAVVAIRNSFSVNGVRAKHGLWAHPSYPGQPSRLVFDLFGAYSSLSGVATLADDVDRSATSLTFEVKGDGRSLWRSKGVASRDDSQWFNLNTSGVEKLELIVHCPGTNDRAHAVWFEPFLVR